MIRWFAHNSVAANLLMVTMMMLGAYSLATQIKVEIFPVADPELISIRVPLRGATPEDAELGLAVRIEEAVDGLEGIKKLRSTSVEGLASVLLEVDEEYDPREVLEEVKTRVDAINTFPAEAERPVISLAQRRYEVISVVVSGAYSEREIRQFAETTRDDLLRISGVSQVTLDAVRRYEIAVEASQDKLREFDLTLADLASAVRTSSLDLSAGNVRTLGGDVLIRSKGQAYRQADFDNIVVKTNPDGSILRLADVATVIDGFTEDAVKTQFDGRNAAFLEVERTGNESALQISALVRGYIEDKQSSLPTGISLDYWDDNAHQLKNRLSVLGKSGLQGAVLVISLLALFLRPKIAIWVFIGIPISFLAAFSVMALFDISLNLMSAFGFIVVLGIVVDDAIVTGESIYRRLRMGDTDVDASVNGTLEVAAPVTFGVLTTMVAFIPLVYMEGRFGSIMGPVAAVVTCVLLFSLIESKLVLPAHLKGMGEGFEKENPGRFSVWQQKFANGFEDKVLRYYQPGLAYFVQHRYTTLMVFVGTLLIILASLSSGWMRFSFFPSIQGETATATLTMPVGTQYAVTDRQVEKMFQAARTLQEKYVEEDTGESVIKHILTSTGSRRGSLGANFGRVRFELVPPEERTLVISTNEVVAEWRRLIGPIPGAESLTFRSSFLRIGNPIDVQLSGNSLETLSEVADRVKAQLATYPSVYEIADTLSDGKEELRIELTPQGHVLGLTRSAVVGQVSQAFLGFQAQRIQRGRDDIRVLIRLPQHERANIATLNDMLIRSPGGRQIPLSHVATLTPGKGPQQITRIDRYRTVNVTAEVDKANTNMTALSGDLESYLQDVLQTYPDVQYSLEGEAREQSDSFNSLLGAVVMVLFAIYCMLALPLKSYTKPFVVMSVIPFAVIGSVIGHFIMGYTLSMTSVLGILALSGVVVNDSLVLVDAVNKQRAQGLDYTSAVLNAGVIRFRPIILTSLTTFFGLMPLMLEKSTTSQFLIPMGISLGFGILFATLITLVLVPTNLLIAHELKAKFRRLVFGEANLLPADERR